MKKLLLFLALLNRVLFLYSSELTFQISGHTDQDLIEAVEIYKKAFSDERKKLSPLYKERTVADYAQNKQLLLLIKSQGEIIAFSEFGLSKDSQDVMYITTMGTKVNNQKRGIGTALLDFLITQFNPTKIAVMAYDAVVPFYEKNGFVKKKGIGYKVAGITEMEKEITTR